MLYNGIWQWDYRNSETLDWWHHVIQKNPFWINVRCVKVLNYSTSDIPENTDFIIPWPLVVPTEVKITLCICTYTSYFLRTFWFPWSLLVPFGERDSPPTSGWCPPRAQSWRRYSSWPWKHISTIKFNPTYQLDTYSTLTTCWTDSLRQHGPILNEMRVICGCWLLFTYHTHDPLEDFVLHGGVSLRDRGNKCFINGPGVSLYLLHEDMGHPPAA